MATPFDMSNIQNLIKQPPPSTMEANSNTSNATKSDAQSVPQRKFNRPNVGVVTPANISKTPMADSIEIRKKENPQSKYKYIPKLKIKGNFQKIVSTGVFLGGMTALCATLIKKFIK
jgi:hypothetical protein